MKLLTDDLREIDAYITERRKEDPRIKDELDLNEGTQNRIDNFEIYKEYAREYCERNELDRKTLKRTLQSLTITQKGFIKALEARGIKYRPSKPA